MSYIGSVHVICPWGNRYSVHMSKSHLPHPAGQNIYGELLKSSQNQTN